MSSPARQCSVCIYSLCLLILAGCAARVVPAASSPKWDAQLLECIPDGGWPDVELPGDGREGLTLLAELGYPRKSVCCELPTAVVETESGQVTVNGALVDSELGCNVIHTCAVLVGSDELSHAFIGQPPVDVLWGSRSSAWECSEGGSEALAQCVLPGQHGLSNVPSPPPRFQIHTVVLVDRHRWLPIGGRGNGVVRTPGERSSAGAAVI